MYVNAVHPILFFKKKCAPKNLYQKILGILYYPHFLKEFLNEYYFDDGIYTMDSVVYLLDRTVMEKVIIGIVSAGLLCKKHIKKIPHFSCASRLTRVFFSY